jgi:predicted CXXCH cytochrome family protein
MRNVFTHKKEFLAVGICVILLFLLAMAANSASIFNSKHDLSYLLDTDPNMNNVYNQYGEVCVYCHTPHAANSNSAAPLWNRNNPTGPYNMYNSDTIDTTIPGTPSSISLACLSCQDGTLAVDEIINAPGSGANLSGPWYGNSEAPTHKKMGRRLNDADNCASCHNGQGLGPAPAADHRHLYLETDLSDDHPISMTYPTPTEDPYFHSTTDVVSNGHKLYNNKVECSSCHDVHDPGVTPFLRKSNSGSELCLVCHNK